MCSSRKGWWDKWQERAEKTKRRRRCVILPSYIRTALYIRLSVEDNKKRGHSIENQKLVLENFLAGRPEFVVCNTYVDNGATGTNFHRPGFQQMLSDIEAGLIDCVIVKDLSRLGRNSIDTGYYIEQYFRVASDTLYCPDRPV